MSLSFCAKGLLRNLLNLETIWICSNVVPVSMNLSLTSVISLSEKAFIAKLGILRAFFAEPACGKVLDARPAQVCNSRKNAVIQ